MKIALELLEVDLPTSETNVLQKTISIKQHGLIEPISVWKYKTDKGLYRIINGFHRVEAAKRLGWAEIECILYDCPEGAFWDARIQAARQHHDISNERLKLWILECWKRSKWYKKDDHKEVAGALWEIDKTQRYESELAGWLVEKAEKWNVTFDDLKELFVSDFINLKRRFLYHRERVDDALSEKAETFEERVEMEEKIPPSVRGKYVRSFTRYPKEAVLGYLSLEEPEAEFEDFAETWARLDHERGKAEEKRIKEVYDPEADCRKVFRKHYNQLQSSIKKWQATLRAMEDGAELVYQLELLIVSTMESLWPEKYRAADRDEALAELGILRQLLAEEHQLRLDLEAELNERSERGRELAKRMEGVAVWYGD